jgi:peptidoglycan/LPS O-acetylase OafA/YrhL
MPQRQQGRRSWPAWTLLGLTVVLLAFSVAIGLTGGEPWAKVIGFVPVTITFALVGALVTARTGNRLGWLFLAGATVMAVSVAADIYAARAVTVELSGAAWAGWTLTVVLGASGTLFFLIPLLFPDGRPPSPRWRPVVWVAVTAGLVEAVSSAISDVNFSSNFPHLRDPVVLVAPLGTAYGLATSIGPLVFVVGAASMIVRFRRSGDEQRQQLKWFMYASAVAALVVFVAGVASNPLPEFEITVPLIPIAVGVAIFKYRLYDIDRLISRTLSYAIVTGLLVGLYAGLVLLATQVLSITSPVAVAASTLAAAALFSPLRRRVQRAVDRRFNRVRYDADQTVATFAARLQEGADLDAVRSDLLTAVNTAVEPAHISVWTAPATRPQ